jgi:hypothetical protein
MVAGADAVVVVAVLVDVALVGAAEDEDQVAEDDGAALEEAEANQVGLAGGSAATGADGAATGA